MHTKTHQCIQTGSLLPEGKKQENKLCFCGFSLVSWIVTHSKKDTAFARTNQSDFKEYLALRPSVVTTSLVIGSARLTSSTCGPIGNGLENLLGSVEYPNKFLLPPKTILKTRYCQGFCLCPSSHIKTLPMSEPHQSFGPP